MEGNTTVKIRDEGRADKALDCGIVA